MASRFFKIENLSIFEVKDAIDFLKENSCTIHTAEYVNNETKNRLADFITDAALLEFINKIADLDSSTKSFSIQFICNDVNRGNWVHYYLERLHKKKENLNKMFKNQLNEEDNVVKNDEQKR